MHLDADEEEQQQAADAAVSGEDDLDAISTWTRGQSDAHSQGQASEGDSSTVTAGAAKTGGTHSDSPLPQPPNSAGEGSAEGEAREGHTEHDEAAANQATVKPNTDAAAAAAAAAVQAEREA